ncbi:hypothetical protein [Jeongeupia naejangsanensis]|uniref:Uncharacterized protein n=1 Tax=Jeongeupia naejangsanensis TaxID=613195 RepID=A0ABS2BI32_9NEIS|nr:hypothetical protein [Jeongeupia naejangsanensis]MBM3114743.1 hypothetical protein [Jeongeupia naejangsanensis]
MSTSQFSVSLALGSGRRDGSRDRVVTGVGDGNGSTLALGGGILGAGTTENDPLPSDNGLPPGHFVWV